MSSLIPLKRERSAVSLSTWVSMSISSLDSVYYLLFCTWCQDVWEARRNGEPKLIFFVHKVCFILCWLDEKIYWYKNIEESDSSLLVCSDFKVWAVWAFCPVRKPVWLSVCASFIIEEFEISCLSNHNKHRSQACRSFTRLHGTTSSFFSLTFLNTKLVPFGGS